MAYLQLGINASRADDAIDKAYADGGTSDLLSISTWEGWLTDDWNTLLGWFGSPVPGTTTQTSVWTTIVSDIINPLNAIETQASNVIVSITHDLTDIFTGIFGTTTPTTTTKVAAASVANVLGGGSLGADVQSILDYISNALGHTGTGHTLTQVETYLGLIPPANVTNVLGTSTLATDVQGILDFIANGLGHSGTGHTLTDIETYLGLIPAANVTGTFPQSQITGLATALSNLLGTTTFQSLLDGISNVMGHSGTGHTVTDVETYLGLIPPANVTNVLGGSNLGADVSAVNTTTTSHASWFTQILTALGLGGGTSTGTNIGGAITSAATTASGAASAASTNTTNLTNTWSWVFGTTTPTSSTPVQSTKVANVLGGSSLGADVQAILDFVANGLGHSGTGHSLTDIETYLGIIPSGNVTGTFPQSQITGLATALSNLLGTTTFQALLDGVSNALGHSGTGHTVTDVETYLGLIPPTNVSNVLGGSSLGADLGALSTALYGGTSVGSTVQVSAIPTGIPQNNISGLVSSLASFLGTTTFQALLDGISNALGQTGTGHTVTQVETYLGLIPPANVTNALGTASLATDVQAILDFVANGLGHSGTGHTLTNIETYLGLIPAANVTGTFPQSQITGLATALSNLLGTTTFQSLLDGIANTFGHSGTGHTITDIETYFGIIPPANVANVLGGANLGADLTSVNSTATTASSTATTANTTANTVTTNLTNSWSWLFGTTTPTSSTPVLSTKVANVLGGSSLGADVQAILDYISNALGHTGTGHTLTQVETYLGLIPPANVTNVLGGSNLGADIQAILDFVANGLGHSGTGHTLTDIETYLGLIPAANVTGTFPQSQITGLATALSNLLGTTTFQSLLDGIANTFGHSGTGHTITDIETYLGIIPPANVANVLGGANLGADLTAVSSTASTASTTASAATTNLSNTWSWLFGTTTPTSSNQVTATKVANVLGGTSLAADVSSVNTTTTSHNTWFTQILSALGLGGGAGTGTNIAGAISSAATAASSAGTAASAAQSTANSATSAASTNSSNLTNTWSWLFGTTTPTSSNTVSVAKVATPFSGANLSADLTAWVNNIFGTGNNPTTSQVLVTQVTPLASSGTSSASLHDDLQAVADQINLATSGGSATGTPISGIAQNLLALPQENIAVNTAAGATAVTVDTATQQVASGTVINLANGAAQTWTINHTPVSNQANYLLVALNCTITHAMGALTPTAFVTGTGQTLTPSILFVGVYTFTSNGQIVIGVPIPPGIAGTGNSVQVTFGFQNTSGGGQSIYTTSIQSLSVIGWNSTSAVLQAPDGQNSNPSQAIPSIITGELVVNMMTVNWSTSPTLTSYSQTAQENSGVINGTSIKQATILGTSLATGTVTFSANCAATNNLWNSLIFILKPSPGALVGSGIRQYRSLGTASGSTGTNKFAAGFFDTTRTGQQSGDLAVASNAVTITLAGWYMVEIRVLLSAFSASLGMVTLSPVLYKNNAVEHCMPGVSAAFNVVGAQDFTSHMGGCALVYCNIGDILQPGYMVDGAGTLSTLTFTGSQTQTHWSVALINRSLL